MASGNAIVSTEAFGGAGAVEGGKGENWDAHREGSDTRALPAKWPNAPWSLKGQGAAVGGRHPVCLRRDSDLTCISANGGAPYGPWRFRSRVSEPSASLIEAPAGTTRGGRSAQWERYRRSSVPQGCLLAIWVPCYT